MAETARRTTSAKSSRSFKGAAGGLSPTAILDIVERLGLVDILIERVKQRLEDVDVDEVLDEVGNYLRRNPEVLVVSLGAVTIAAGALVFLNRNSAAKSR